jgi:adenine-specific DNA glycosylase
VTKTSEFQELIWAKSRELYRDMPWRDEPTFYRVLVSEPALYSAYRAEQRGGR